MTTDDGSGAAAPPAELLAALSTDVWAWLLPHVRAALQELADEDVTPVIRRLATAPTGKLAGGRARRELIELLAAEPQLWRRVACRVRASDPPETLRWLVAGPPDSADGGPPPTTPTSPVEAAATGGPEADDERRGLRDRLRRVRDERDASRRQLAGAEARAAALERRLVDAEAERDAAVAERDRLAEQLAGAGDARERAVERERRRRDAEVDRLEATIGELRRAEHERRTERLRRAEERRRRAAEEAVQRRTAGPDDDTPARLVPGRPSRLPRGVVEGTTEAVDLLLHPGRLVLVDGYNVTKQRHPGLDLEGQRNWLVQLLAGVAARRRVRPVVVFDGERGGASRPRTGGREMQVRFTPSGVSADDEIVLAVEATDEPVVVVTDDRELVARVRASGADVIATRPFLAAVR